MMPTVTFVNCVCVCVCVRGVCGYTHIYIYIYIHELQKLYSNLAPCHKKVGGLWSISILLKKPSEQWLISYVIISDQVTI